jgi:hypothetical protein
MTDAAGLAPAVIDGDGGGLGAIADGVLEPLHATRKSAMTPARDVRVNEPPSYASAARLTLQRDRAAGCGFIVARRSNVAGVCPGTSEETKSGTT